MRKAFAVLSIVPFCLGLMGCRPSKPSVNAKDVAAMRAAVAPALAKIAEAGSEFGPKFSSEEALDHAKWLIEGGEGLKRATDPPWPTGLESTQARYRQVSDKAISVGRRVQRAVERHDDAERENASLQAREIVDLLAAASEGLKSD